MKKFRVVVSIIMIFLSIVVYSISMTLIKNEDFIGSYYCVNIKSDIVMEVCGTATGIIDQKNDETIISNIDSLIVVGDVIYGICRNKYFLLNIANRKVAYSPVPMLQYTTYSLLCPMEYYKRKTRLIDTVCLVVLFCCIIFIIRVGFFHASKKTEN